MRRLAIAAITLTVVADLYGLSVLGTFHGSGNQPNRAPLFAGTSASSACVSSPTGPRPCVVEAPGHEPTTVTVQRRR